MSATSRATLIVIATGVFWGLYWIPVRCLDTAGLSGAWGTVGIAIAGMLCLFPFAFRARQTLFRADPVAIGALFLGGAGFALYSISFVYGRVAIVTLLFFLTPVWSTLIARYALGVRTAPLRLVAIGVGLAGLAVMLGAQGDWPVPRSLGEWMGLASGVLWAIGSTGIRERSTLAPVPSAFVFVCGAATMAVLLAPSLAPIPQVTAAAIAVAVGAGALWWGVSIAALMWATAQLDPARTGILLMSEVLVAALTAALLAGEHLHPAEIAGGALVVLAGVLEVWPVRRPF